MARLLPRFGDDDPNGAVALHLQGRRLAGSAARILEAAQPAGDFSYPPVRCLALTKIMSRSVGGTCDIGGGSFSARIPRGGLVLIPPKVATTFLLDNDHVIRVLAIDSAWIRPHLDRAQNASDFGRLHERPFESTRVGALMDRLWAETHAEDGVTQLHAEGLLLLLVAELLREAKQPLPAVQGGLSPWQLLRVTDYLTANLDRDVALADLAAEVDLSEYHLCTAFRRSTGLPPHRWLTLRRMEQAKVLMGEGKTGLAEIALAVGYGSQSAFGAAFRRVLGVTPTAWQRSRSAP